MKFMSLHPLALGMTAILLSLTSDLKVNAQFVYESGRMGTFYKVYIYKKHNIGGGKWRFQTKTVFNCGTPANPLPNCKIDEPYVSEWRIADCFNSTINGKPVYEIARSGYEHGEFEVFKSVCRVPRKIVNVSQGLTSMNSIAGSWSGHYYCSQGLTRLHLDIRTSENNAVHATFIFSEHPNNPGVPSGSFQMQGKIENGDRIILKGGKWIRRPVNYETVNLDGRINFKNSRIDGNVTGKVGRCTTFSLSRQSSIPSTSVPNTPLLKRILQSITPKNQPAFNERKLEKTRKALDIQQIILELESKGSTISTRDLLDGYEYLIEYSVEIGEILAIANNDYALADFFDSAGKITDSVAAARLIIDFASIHRSLRSGDKESAVVKLLEIGLSKNLMADIYLKLSGQDVKKDIATIFNINKVRDLLVREIDGHFDKMPRIRELIQNLNPQSPYSAFEKELQDAGLWHEWQKYLTSDIARNYNSIF